MSTVIAAQLTGGTCAGSESHARLRAVGKAYSKGRTRFVALDAIDLDIGRSEFVSIIGPSGCGKSTLLMLLAGLAQPTSGTVSIDGATITGPISDVGIVFQRDLLFDWRDILDNVLLQAEVRGLDPVASRSKALQLLAQAGLGGFEQRRPWELSGGMRQRVALCRALLHDASLLLLDEPFGALDAITRDQMNLDLQRMWMQHRSTAVMVTHSISEAVFLSDRVVVMGSRPGRILEVIEVPLPRPRSVEMRDSEAFVLLQRRLRNLLEPG